MKGLNVIGKKTVHQRLLCGGRMLLETNDHLAQQMRCEESFEPAVRNEVVRIASHGVNVIDIGANIGYFTVMASKLIGAEKRVFAFEPQARIVERLRRNVALNPPCNVEIFPIALSDRAGTVTFNLPPIGKESYGSIHANGRFEVMTQVEVETQRLDDVMSKLGNPQIGLIKMDAEGAELPILRGAEKLLSSPARPALIFEANEENCKPFGYCVFDLLQYVHSLGYRLRQLDGEDWIAEL
jgi:FkbM family methyltransferase